MGLRVLFVMHGVLLYVMLCVGLCGLCKLLVCLTCDVSCYGVWFVCVFCVVLMCWISL